MKEILIDTGSSKIKLGAYCSSLDDYIEAKRLVYVVDHNVARLYPDIFKDHEKLVIQANEQDKTLDTVYTLYNHFNRLELDRSCVVVAVGGGIVCDIAAFAAATYLRGLRCTLVPTTLLAQLDAAIGGKNGVNFQNYKNLVGTIRQPELILCDPEFLKTLEHKELSNGYAEMIKHALIADAEFFGLLAKKREAAFALEGALMYELLEKAIKIKIDIVKKDELEHGERMKLNLGHTIAHALENHAQLQQTELSHGAAVSIGIVAEAKIAMKQEMLSNSEFTQIQKVLADFMLPIDLPMAAGKLSDAISRDKKWRGESLKIPLLQGIGSAVIKSFSLAEFQAAIDEN